jgi:CopG family transcriptional regulator/antitoxin EndoAI
MRTTRVVSITLPPPLFEEAKALAKLENRTMSELMREALRRYQRDREWEEVLAYGRAAAERAGIRGEDEVVDFIHEFRKQASTDNTKQAVA